MGTSYTFCQRLHLYFSKLLGIIGKTWSFSLTTSLTLTKFSMNLIRNGDAQNNEIWHFGYHIYSFTELLVCTLIGAIGFAKEDENFSASLYCLFVCGIYLLGLAIQSAYFLYIHPWKNVKQRTIAKTIHICAIAITLIIVMSVLIHLTKGPTQVMLSLILAISICAASVCQCYLLYDWFCINFCFFYLGASSLHLFCLLSKDERSSSEKRQWVRWRASRLERRKYEPSLRRHRCCTYLKNKSQFEY